MSFFPGLYSTHFPGRWAVVSLFCLVVCGSQEAFLRRLDAWLPRAGWPTSILMSHMVARCCAEQLAFAHCTQVGEFTYDAEVAVAVEVAFCCQSCTF